jgi:hypothetical protein
MASTATPASHGTMLPDAGGGQSASGSIERCVAAVERNSVWVLAGLMLLSGALLLYMGRELTFYYDEWEWIAKDYGGGLHTMFVAHVGNISIFPVLVYKALFHLVGLDHYEVFRLDVIVLHLLCGLLVYMLAARRIARVSALLAAAVILFLGAAWEDLLWAFQVGYLLSVAGGLATWLLLEERRRWCDVAAMLCLVVSMGSSSLGIAVMVGIGVELAWRREARRMWIFLIPAVLYVLWYLTYGESQVTESSLINAPGFAEDLAASAFGGLAGRGLDWGRPLALVGLLILLWRLVRGAPVSARLASLIAAALALWAITAAARSTISPPESSRYIYLGAVLIVLIAVELLRGIAITPRASALAAAVVALCAVTGFTLIQAGASGLRATSKTVAAELGALEVAAAYAPAEYRPDPVKAPPVYASSYLHTVRAIGSSPADSPAGIAASDPVSRDAADSVLLALEAPKLISLGHTKVALAPGLAVSALASGRESRRGGCLMLTPTSRTSLTAAIELPQAGLVIHDKGSPSIALAFRRFGETFKPSPQAVGPRSSELLTRLPDSARQPWLAQLSSSSPLVVCRAAG